MTNGDLTARTFDIMIFFTSDNHLDRSTPDTIEHWNSVVTDDDTVYIVGDLLSAKTAEPSFYLEKLKAKKILVLGNNDPFWLRRLSEYEKNKYFNGIVKNIVLEVGDIRIEMSHYPKKRKYDFLICGHIHSSMIGKGYKMLSCDSSSFNAGVMINGGAPVVFSELARYNAAFYGRSYSDTEKQLIDKTSKSF